MGSGTGYVGRASAAVATGSAMREVGRSAPGFDLLGAADAAFDTLRSYARNTNQKLSDVAQALLTGTLTAEALPLP